MGATEYQDNAYAWRSDGLLASRASRIGGNNAKKEEFAYDPLGRLTTATTKLGGSATATRTLTQTLFGAIEVGVTLTGMGYLGRVGVKGAARAYDAYKAAKNAKRAANPGVNRRGGFTGPHRQRWRHRGLTQGPRKDPSGRTSSSQRYPSRRGSLRPGTPFPVPSTTIREAAWATADGPPTIHPRSFFGIAYFSVLFNVTGQVAVVGIPDITQLFFRCGTTKSG